MKNPIKWIFQILYLLTRGWRPSLHLGRWRWSRAGHRLQSRLSAVLLQRGTWPGPLLSGPRKARGAGQHRCPSCRAMIQARRCRTALHVVGTVIWCPACNKPALPADWRQT